MTLAYLWFHAMGAFKANPDSLRYPPEHFRWLTWQTGHYMEILFCEGRNGDEKTFHHSTLPRCCNCLIAVVARTCGNPQNGVGRTADVNVNGCHEKFGDRDYSFTRESCTIAMIDTKT
ncbi:MAG TPA: hypothetical protein PLK04_05285 [Bacillota bacterium]|nr:hypothetical protein [Bacillota bacterium]HPZ13631.1 hypothetical protein [Bacillota bacterium]